MNTRLQVEHPVSELIAGVDLVQEQIKVARGEKLSFTQADLRIKGHAIEVRVYAEDPTNKFLPDIGTLEVYRLPEGEGVRVDDGFVEGMTIPINYDPMIAKLIVHADSREAAIARMKVAIKDYVIGGITTTLPFGQYVMGHESFVSGNYDTHFVRDHFTPKDVMIADSRLGEIALTSGVYDSDFQENKHTPEVEVEAGAWKLRRR